MRLLSIRTQPSDMYDVGSRQRQRLAKGAVMDANIDRIRRARLDLRPDFDIDTLAAHPGNLGLDVALRELRIVPQGIQDLEAPANRAGILVADEVLSVGLAFGVAETGPASVVILSPDHGHGSRRGFSAVAPQH